jgi:cytidylate kinase
MTLIVTVDGPSGTGKSTVSRAISELTGLPHLDTGAFYRAATLAVLEAGVDPDDPEEVPRLVEGITLDQADGITYLDGRDVSKRIREVPVSQAVSAVSAHPEVRSLLVSLQRPWVADRGGRAVVEGRDIGSVVFPDADLKVYLDARPEVRAARRALERGEDPTKVARAIELRDRLDSTRPTSPLIVPDGAMVVDTSDMTFEEVVDHIAGLMPKS